MAVGLENYVRVDLPLLGCKDNKNRSVVAQRPSTLAVAHFLLDSWWERR
jgi:hypothetical protein